VSIFDDDHLTQGQRLVWFALQEMGASGTAADNCSKIAGHMDSSRAHVSRSLQVLERRGWISRDGGIIHIHKEPPGRDSHTRNRDSDARDRDSQARHRDSDTQNCASQTRDRDSDARKRDSDARSENPSPGKKKSSTKEKTPPSLASTTAAAPGAQARDGDAGGSDTDADPFEVEVDSVDAITRASFGEPVRGMSIKDQIRTYCERAGPEGWDCLRSVCALISEKGWNPTAQLVKKKLTDQLALLEESDEAHDPDDFASQAQRIFEAAGEGAGAH